jgi:hypothetical protein
MLAQPAALQIRNAGGVCSTGIRVQDMHAGMGAQIKVPKSDIALHTSIANLNLVASLLAWIKVPAARLECDIGILVVK